MTRRPWFAVRGGLAVIGILVMVGSASAASAHSTADGLTVQVNERTVRLRAEVPFEEVYLSDDNGDGLIDAAEINDQRDYVTTRLATAVEVTADGQLLPVAIIDLLLSGGEASEHVTVDVVSEAHDGNVGTLALTWALANDGELVTAVHPDGVSIGRLTDDGSVVFSFGAWSTVTGFVRLGVDHIAGGLDHLLFLVVLTAGVVGLGARRVRWRELIRLVSTFTAGHAISLGLAYFGLVSVPAGIVEPAIALSIVVGAVAIRWESAIQHRTMAVAGIGVIHGLGFAGSLASQGLIAGNRWMALASFNIGVDIAQIAVVCVIASSLVAFTHVLGRLGESALGQARPDWISNS